MLHKQTKNDIDMKKTNSFLTKLIIFFYFNKKYFYCVFILLKIKLRHKVYTFDHTFN